MQSGGLFPRCHSSCWETEWASWWVPVELATSIILLTQAALKPHTRSYASTAVSPKPPQYGQPLSFSHPHLVQPDELTMGIPASEYEDRRKRLMQSLPEGSTVICMGGTVRLVSQCQ